MRVAHPARVKKLIISGRSCAELLFKIAWRAGYGKTHQVVEIACLFCGGRLLACSYSWPSMQDDEMERPRLGKRHLNRHRGEQ